MPKPSVRRTAKIHARTIELVHARMGITEAIIPLFEHNDFYRKIIEKETQLADNIEIMIETQIELTALNTLFQSKMANLVTLEHKTKARRTRYEKVCGEAKCLRTQIELFHILWRKHSSENKGRELAESKMKQGSEGCQRSYGGEDLDYDMAS